jgi:hypothetical protein
MTQACGVGDTRGPGSPGKGAAHPSRLHRGILSPPAPAHLPLSLSLPGCLSRSNTGGARQAGAASLYLELVDGQNAVTVAVSLANASPAPAPAASRARACPGPPGSSRDPSGAQGEAASESAAASQAQTPALALSAAGTAAGDACVGCLYRLLALLPAPARRLCEYRLGGRAEG